jgi:hypothetical protein
MKLKNKIAFIQSAIDGLSKDKENPFFKSSYVDLNQAIDALRPLEREQKISITMPLTNCEGQPAISLVINDLETDEVETNVMPLPQLTDPQKIGSAITYYRRYMLMSFFNLKAEDDDGEGARPKPIANPVAKLNEKYDDLDF